MATITKRGPKQWQAKVRKKGYKPISRTFATKARAERWAVGVESDMENRVFVDSSLADSTTFDEIGERFHSLGKGYRIRAVEGGATDVLFLAKSTTPTDNPRRLI